MVLPHPAASKSSQDGLRFGQAGPRSFQHGSKTSPRPPQDDVETLLLASSFPSSIWVRSGSNLGSISHPPFAPKTTRKSNQKMSENHVAARRPPRSLQDGPGRPTTPRMTPTEAQDVTKTPPGRPQNPPRRSLIPTWSTFGMTFHLQDAHTHDLLIISSPPNRPLTWSNKS